MRPTSRELLESIRWALDEKVAPAVQDRWAASTLRSVRTLLDHLVVRVECEHELAAATHDDLRTVLTEARALLDDAASEPWSSLRAELDTALSDDAAPLETQSAQLLDLCDRLLRALRSHPAGIPAGTGEHVHSLLTAFLARQIERERPLFMPAFMGKLF